MRYRLLRGAMASLLAGLVSRALGALYRLFLARLVGETGIGLLQMAMPVYYLAVIVASLGLPTGVAKLVAEGRARSDERSIERTLREALRLAVAVAVVAAAGLWWTAPWLAQRLLQEGRAAGALRWMPLALLIAVPSGLLRGYFQGLDDLETPSIAQLAEQLVHAAAVLALARLLLPRGLAAVVTGSVFGVALGEAAGLAVYVLAYRRRTARPLPWRPAGRGVRRGELARLSLPVMVVSLTGALSSTLDAVLIPRRLERAGLAPAAAVAAYGRVVGMALPVLYLPMVAVYPLAVMTLSGVSAASEARSPASLRRQLTLYALLAAVIGLATSLLLLAAPAGVARLLYGQATVAPLLLWLVPAAPLLYVGQIFSSALNGLGRTGAVLANGTAGLAVRLALLWLLTGDPRVGEAGPLIAFAAGSGVTLGLSFLALARAIRGSQPAGRRPPAPRWRLAPMRRVASHPPSGPRS
ncbi:MAG: oligosaccharide flippase family protein [Clostridia bacterium]|nr:oligosaccharide flippase family protein [Clostridia bacterium]MCL6522495.1 oligosaccharide flippase family protein [Bacillota bacterium]